MRIIRLTTTFDEEKVYWTATVPSLPGVVTEGSTINDAVRNVKEAIQLWVDGSAALGTPLPPHDAPDLEDEPDTRFEIRLYMGFVDNPIDNPDLAML